VSSRRKTADREFDRLVLDRERHARLEAKARARAEGSLWDSTPAVLTRTEVLFDIGGYKCITLVFPPKANGSDTGKRSGIS
jgi:hypothetical protein